MNTFPIRVKIAIVFGFLGLILCLISIIPFRDEPHSDERSILLCIGLISSLISLLVCSFSREEETEEYQDIL